MAADPTLEDLATCPSCNRMAAQRAWLDRVARVALARNTPPRRVVEWALRWFHAAGHPAGQWRPTGIRHLPVVGTHHP